MATEAQIHANRLNGQRSTGPRTPQGKAVVAQNAVKHGLSGRLDVIKGEDQAEFELHREAMLGELAPAGPMESMLAERVVGLSWRLERVERTQNEVFDALLADRSSPLAKLVRSLEPKGAGRPEGESDGDDDLALGRVALKDFSNSRVLDRLLMYERRIEHSLYKTMAELQRLRLLRELDSPAKEPVCSVPGWGERPRSPEEVGRGRPTYEETPDGVTTNAPPAGGCPPGVEMPHHSNIPSFQHSIREPGDPAPEDQSCKTKPISQGADGGQLSDDKGVMEDSPESGLGKTKPISAGPDQRGAAGTQEAGTDNARLAALFH